jgi:hypothetical protein
MPRCTACDCEMSSKAEVMRGYCDTCQVSVRQVFDADAYALGHTTTRGDTTNNIDWTNYLDGEDI